MDPVHPERLDPDPVNIRPDPQPRITAEKKLHSLPFWTDFLLHISSLTLYLYVSFPKGTQCLIQG